VPVRALCHFSKIKKAVHQKPAFSGKIPDSALLHIKKDSVTEGHRRSIGRALKKLSISMRSAIQSLAEKRLRKNEDNKILEGIPFAVPA
jgi:hypothetical protein